MREYKMRVRYVDAPNDVWVEQISIPDGVDKLEFCKRICIEYNQEEDHRKTINPRYVGKHREIVEVLDPTGVQYCDTFKVNLATIIRDKYPAYDIYRCKRCKFFYQRFGFEALPEIKCEPELACTNCNKKFKTKVNRDKHMAKNKHKEPDWLPDGV